MTRKQILWMRIATVALFAAIVFIVATAWEVGDEPPPCVVPMPTVDLIDPCDEPYMPVVTLEDGATDITELPTEGTIDITDNTFTAESPWEITFERTEDVRVTDDNGVAVIFNLPEGKDDTYWKGVDIHNLCLWPVEAESYDHPPIYLIDQC